MPKRRIATGRFGFAGECSCYNAAVSEAEYFRRLEMRVSRELAGMRQKELRGWWCDGFIPEKFVVTRSGCHIAGQVWMDNGRHHQTLWNFVVLLGRSIVTRDEVKWAELMPAEDVTDWLSLDFENEFMKVKPFAARRDGEPAVTRPNGL
jgi:hypothetical protein